MGLAAAKNKRRLGNDPNNTKWSRNTESFGQKMLRSQGWEPGQYLGAKDAAQADRYTEANSSHIKVVLKDNNLGLGAKQGGDNESTGLFAFQHLLGRLNGKTEDVLEAELVAREDVMRSAYLERRIGTIRFVRGGWLVGDVLKEDIAEEESSKSDVEMTISSAEEETTKSEKKSKKRKAERETDEKPSKKDKKSKKRKTETEAESDSDDGESRSKKRKSSKKSKKQAAAEEDSSDSSDEATTTEKWTRKEEKKERKRLRAEKRERKERRRKEKAGGGSGAESSGDSISREKKRRKAGGDGDKETVVLSSVPASGTATPVEGGSGTSTPISLLTSNRYLSRKRFIAQKTMAFSDAAAMNQIFMIKS